jgi:putative membrane protein
MMWYWGSGYGWGMAIFGMLMMLVFWGGIIAAIVFVARAVTGPRFGPGDSALAELRRRLAAGDISPEEFDRLRKVLQG